jgi:ketosteroid isomerase-like protein
MAEHPNAALIRRSIEAMNTQDFAYLDSIMADDIVWHVIGAAEPIRGKEAMSASMGGDRGFEITVQLHDVTASDDHVVALVNAHAVRDGKTLDYNTAEIFHVKDGKVTERWAFSDDTARITEFFA